MMEPVSFAPHPHHMYMLPRPVTMQPMAQVPDHQHSHSHSHAQAQSPTQSQSPAQSQSHSPAHSHDSSVSSRISKRKDRRSPKTAKKVRSSKSNIPGESRYWTPSEHKLFVQALLRYGPKDLKSIANHVGTRNMIQCRTHEQKCFMRLMREAQKETAKRGEGDFAGLKQPKDVYSVSSSCGITLLCVVSEEMSRALQS